MTSEMDRIRHLSLAADTSLAPREAAALKPSLPAPAPARPSAPIAGDRGFQSPPFPAATAPDPIKRTVGNRSLRTRLFLLDLFAALASWLVVRSAMVTASTTANRLAPGAAAAVASLIAMRTTGLYRSRLCLRKSQELWKIFICGLWGLAALLVVQSQMAPPGPEALVGAGTFVVTATFLRWLFGRWLRAQRAQGRYLRNLVLIGSNEDGAELRTMFRSEPELGYVVSAVVGDGHRDPVWDGLPGSSSVTDIPTLAMATGASGILIVPSALSSAISKRAIRIAATWNLHVQVWPGLGDIGSRRIRQVPVSGEAFFYVEPRISSRWQLAAKRTVDVTGAVIGLALCAPFIGLAAVLIKLEDGGPVFHRSERVGRFGRVIQVHKLRSMIPNADFVPDSVAVLNERTDGPLFKASNDPRVTRIGRIIRATSIDELPQLWDVLRGTMSLVGPRPALPSEVAQFDEELMRRHLVRPGVTGLWQVEARNNPSFNAYRRLDLHYINNWTLALDISIILSTVPSLLSQAAHSFANSRRT